MEQVRLNEHLVEITAPDGRKARVERGPAPKTAVASKETLSDDVTAEHYKLGALDALGRPIVEGQEFAYLDWMGPHAWYVYSLAPESGPDAWVERGHYVSEAEALAAATTILS